MFKGFSASIRKLSYEKAVKNQAVCGRTSVLGKMSVCILCSVSRPLHIVNCAKPSILLYFLCWIALLMEANNCD